MRRWRRRAALLTGAFLFFALFLFVFGAARSLLRRRSAGGQCVLRALLGFMTFHIGLRYALTSSPRSERVFVFEELSGSSSTFIHPSRWFANSR
jgi:hypothetical protein